MTAPDLDQLERVLDRLGTLAALGPSRDDGQAAECRRGVAYLAEQVPSLVSHIREMEAGLRMSLRAIDGDPFDIRVIERARALLTAPKEG